MNAPDQIDAQFWTMAESVTSKVAEGDRSHVYEAFKRRWQAEHRDADPVSHEYAMRRLVAVLKGSLI